METPIHHEEINDLAIFLRNSLAQSLRFVLPISFARRATPPMHLLTVKGMDGVANNSQCIVGQSNTHSPDNRVRSSKADRSGYQDNSGYFRCIHDAKEGGNCRLSNA